MANRFREKIAEQAKEKETEEGLEAPGAAASEDATDEAQSTEESRSTRVAHALSRVLGGDVLGDKLVVRQIPLLLVCLVGLLLLVANRYAVESLSREKMAAQENIIYLREHRIQMQKQYQRNVKISQLAEDLKETGVGITAGPPYEL